MMMIQSRAVMMDDHRRCEPSVGDPVRGFDDGRSTVTGVDEGTVDPVASAERLTLELAQFGTSISAAMGAATGLPDLMGNTPLLVLCLLDLDGPARPSAIGAVVQLTSGGTTKLLDRLEQAGLILRRYGVLEDDHRGVLVELTDDGRRTIRSAAQALIDHLPEAVSMIKSISALVDSLAARTD
jgi:DNA-binding MarR family transcriptional regulator